METKSRSACGEGASSSENLDFSYVLRLRPFRALFGFKFDSVALGQGPKAFAADCGVMDKNVFAAVIRSNEPKPLRVVEPLHCSFHRSFLGLQIIRRSRVAWLNSDASVTINGECRLLSRNGNSFKSFPVLSAGIADELRAPSAILDGEIGCLDAYGHRISLSICEQLRQTLAEGAVLHGS